MHRNNYTYRLKNNEGNTPLLIGGNNESKIKTTNTKNKIVRLYARKEGIQSIKIDGVRYTFKEGETNERN